MYAMRYCISDVEFFSSKLGKYLCHLSLTFHNDRFVSICLHSNVMKANKMLICSAFFSFYPVVMLKKLAQILFWEDFFFVSSFTIVVIECVLAWFAREEKMMLYFPNLTICVLSSSLVDFAAG